MGYCIYLENKNGESVKVPKFAAGGTYQLDGNIYAELNITYNYAGYFSIVFGEKGIRWLDGKRAYTTTMRLKAAIDLLGTKQHDNYWEATKGNAGYALSILLNWATLHPNAIWSVLN